MDGGNASGEEKRREWLRRMSPEDVARFDIPKEMTTCFTCEDNITCEFAWDPYNTDGDCLASK